MHLLVLLLACLLAGRGWAEGCAAGALESARVVSVSERLDIRLEDGRIVFLPVLEPPRATKAGPDRPRALAAEVQAMLAQGASRLQWLGPADRWGRWPARLFPPNQDDSLAEILLGGGLAQRGVLPAPCDHAARAAEASAQAAGLGLWSDPAFSVLSAERFEDFREREGTLALIEGVVSVARTPARIYLNFRGSHGLVYASIAKKHWRAFERADLTETHVRSRKLRLRGILEFGPGLHMDLFHPSQIEFMDGAEALAPSDRKF